MKRTVEIMIILVICSLLLQTANAATGDITGQIIEKETMAPVAYAQVTLDNGTTKTVIAANEYGYYEASDLPTGKYEVSVKYDNRVVSMNAIHIKDSHTADINFIVSSSTSSVEVKEIKWDNTPGALRQHPDGNYPVMPVKPTQGPVKAPLADHNQNNDLNIMPVNPLVIATKSPLA